MPPLPAIEVDRLGTVTYEDGLAWQHAAAATVRAGGPERLAILQHHPVYTLGARASRSSLRVAEEALPAPLVVTTRGGDVTFHGPGQLVAYPVLDVRRRGLRPGDYVRALEDIVIRALGGLDVAGVRWPGRPGVWVASVGEPRKVAAIGVRIEQGVSAHGLALNVSTDLGWFDPIVPCGIADAGVTSIARERGVAPPFETVVDRVLEAFGAVLGSAMVDASVESREPVHA